MNAALQSELASRPVDESIMELETRSKNTSPSANRSQAVGPFGVLDFTGTQRSVETPSIANPEQSLESHTAPVDVPNTTSPQTDLSFESLNNMDDFLDWPDLFELDFNSPELTSSGIGYALPAGSPGIEDSYRFDQHNRPQQADSDQEYDQQPHDLPLLTSHNPPEASLRNITPADAQSLLKHFNDQVIAHISSLPPSEKPHWFIFNVQSAILTLANVTFMQTSSSSHATLANLMALLAMSAHHLAHQTHSNCTLRASHWRNIGESAIRHAKEHLQHSLRTEVRGPNRAKYKDQIMALSAMLAYAVWTYFVAIILLHPN